MWYGLVVGAPGAVGGMSNFREVDRETGFCGAQDLLCRHAQGGGADLPADRHRHLCQGSLRQLYDRKTPITAAEILNDRVVPFSDEHGIPLCRVLTDRGTEFCGSESHQYELYLAVEDIDHSRTKAKSPQTNGICERFHRTVLDEFYRVAFRKKIYRTLDELQADLDAWITEYNEQRPHQGRWGFGKTPMQTFLDALPLAKEKLMAA
jgi:Integrase core domain